MRRRQLVLRCALQLAAALAEAFGLRYVSSALAAELRCKYHFRCALGYILVQRLPHALKRTLHRVTLLAPRGVLTMCLVLRVRPCRTRCAQAGIRCPGYVHLSSAVNDGQDSRLATLR